MMFYRALHALFTFLTIFYCANSESLTKKNEKRIAGRNDYQCLNSFDVHQDKIIKTKDSRDLGAKYLNVIDVDTRDECLKYCCDTDRCDVFIFEEKKPGSCYLFQCGPLHDFKCRFIGHPNYSSAVRTTYNTQSSAQLEEDVRISQQEHELKSLRKAVDSSPIKTSFTEPPVKMITAVTTSLPAKPTCSRNQYECRSSGDCIAIYNVCDGIPQCTDGSDEAADLLCPTEKPMLSSSMVIQGPPSPPPFAADNLNYQQILDHRHKSLVPLYARGPEINSKPWELPNLSHQVIPQQQRYLYPAQSMEVPQPRKGFGAPGYQWDYQPQYDQNKDPPNPVISFHDQNNLNPYEQEQPHIFNHKGSSVIEDKDRESGVYTDMKHPYTSHFSSSNRGTWQEVQQALPSSSVIPNIQQKPVDEVEKIIVSTTTQPCDTSHEQKETSKIGKEIDETSVKQEKHAYHEKPVQQDTRKASTSKTNVVKYNHVKVKEPKGVEHKSLIVIEDHTRDHGRGNIIAEHLQQVNDNETLRPKGAVISLALGLTITAITATLIACRLRVVRRRGRRGHGPYAHDADYLVNGMYL